MYFKIIISFFIIFLTIGIVSASDDFNQLNEDINLTDDNTTLYLEKDYKQSDDIVNITINKSITIDGKGHSLDADKKGRIFKIEADNVTLMNINFINGKALGLYHNLSGIGGGAIYWSGNNGKLINCTFKNNVADDLLYDPYLEPDEVVDEGNGIYSVIHKVRPMGAATNRGGAIVWLGDNGIIEDCEFVRNTVNYPNAGGAIFSRSDNFKIKSSAFKYNSAFIGSAIYYAGSDLIVNSSSFHNNLGITSNPFISGQNFTLVNVSTFGSFEDLSSEINDSEDTLFLTNDYKLAKGNILINKSITINGLGHTIDLCNSSRAFIIYADNVIIKNLIFINGNSGVGASIVLNGNNSCFINCIFKNNTGRTAGGALAIKGNNNSIINCTFEENSVLYAPYSGFSILYKSGPGSIWIQIVVAYGGAVYIEGDASIVNSKFINNTSPDYGGAIYSRNDDLLINNSVFSKNNASNSIFSSDNQYFSHDAYLKGKSLIINSVFDKEDTVYGENVKYQNITYSSKLNKIAENKDLTIYFKSSKVFSIKLYCDGEAEVNKYVKFTIGKDVVHVKTDENGVASLKITKKPGKYSIICEYGDVKVKNKLTVKSRLITNDLTKKVKKSVNFKVKVLNTEGKAYAKQTVKINFKGKAYKLKTNSKGIATFKLGKNIKKGKYTIKTSYAGLINVNKVVVKR